MNIFVIAAPSGGGKSSLIARLLQTESLKLSTSYTTRNPRPGEQDGREYHFISIAEFRQRQKQQEFLESAEVHGNYYGTSRLWLAEQMDKGVDILLEIDWQGAQQVKKHFPQLVSIFILPPSLQELENRLRNRGQDSEEVIQKRVLGATHEMLHAPEFDYLVVNEDFDTALNDIRSIVNASRLRTNQQVQREAILLSQLGIKD
jgi:guanylate kinase